MQPITLQWQSILYLPLWIQHSSRSKQPTICDKTDKLPRTKPPDGNVESRSTQWSISCNRPCKQPRSWMGKRFWTLQ